jgi:hypothetical protein
MKNKLKDQIFIGVIVDNKDPKRLGRCKIRVFTVYDDIPTEDIPWASPFKDLNGVEYNTLEIGKIVSVSFNKGNIYRPEFISSEHYNINLEKKLKALSDSGYSSMRAMAFDHKTQIYSNDDEGLMIDYKLNNINIVDKSINVNLKDNFATLNLGDASSSQQAILGNNFLDDWFDEFIQNLLGSQGGPYLGNLGAPVVANPAMIAICNKYLAMKASKFLSHNVNIVDNGQVSKKDRPIDGQVGDNWNSTIENNNLSTRENVDFGSKDGIKPSVDDPNYVAPSTDGNPDDIIPKGGTFSNPELSNPSSNPEIDKMVKFMRSKGYVVYTEQYKLNIIAFRNKDNGNISNRFDETLVVFFLNENNIWISKNYMVTTVPGYKPGTNQLPDKVAILQLGQYVDQYKIGYHQNRTGKQGGQIDSKGNLQAEHKCLKLAYSVVLRSKDGSLYDYSSPTDKGSFGINIHHAGNPQSENVNNHSEGCIVFKSYNGHVEFMKYCENQVTTAKKSTFSFTLVKKSEYDSFS